MDQLNSALHELGMLSSVTHIRKQYLQEKSRRLHWYNVPPPTQEASKYQDEAGSSGYCIRKLLGYWDIKSDGSGLAVRSEDLPSSLAAVDDCETRCTYKYSEENLDCQSSTNRVSKMRSGHRTSSYRFQKPYEVPWRRVAEDRCRIFGGNLNNQDSDSSRDSGLGNRSNPGSPERVHRETTAGSASSLSRSRSLDDLVGSLSLAPEPCVEEMDNMSQKMEGLQILEKLVN